MTKSTVGKKIASQEKSSMKSLQEQIHADKQERALAFNKGLEALKKQFNCDIVVQRTEKGMGANVSVEIQLFTIAL